MAKAKRRKPHDPAKAHDRRSRDLPRNAEVASVEVDDPLGLDDEGDSEVGALVVGDVVVVGRGVGTDVVGSKVGRNDGALEVGKDD